MARIAKFLVCCSFVVVVLTVCCSADYTPVTDYFYGSETWSFTSYPVGEAPYTCPSNVYMFKSQYGDDCLFAISTEHGAVAVCNSWKNWDGSVRTDSISITCDTQIGDFWYGHGADGRGFNCFYGGTLINKQPNYMEGYSLPQSVADDFAAFLGTVGPSYSSYVDIPSGYVAVVYAMNPSSSSPAGLRSNFSWASAPNSPYWGNTGQSYKFFDSRPVFTDQTLFPLNGMSAIGWDKGRSTGFNGNTTNAVGEISFSSSLHWCVIYNPWVTFDSSATDPKYNSNIRLYANIAEAYLYPVSQLIGSDGWESRSLDDWSNPYVGNAPVEEGGDWYWTEPSDVPGDPPVVVDPGTGGSNEVPPEVTNLNFLQRIIAILDNLLAEISGLFTFAFRAIVALVDAASGFFAVIGGLFTWLPSDVVTVIVSGFFLVVTIGVLKSFL